MKKKFTITIITIVFLLIALPRENQAADLEGTWTQIAVDGKIPDPRAVHSAIHDPINNRMIIFGGWSSVGYNSRNDVYSLTGTMWDSLVTSGGPPGRRAGHVAVYDTVRHRMVVFGGSDWWWTWYNDTWAFDVTTNTWTQLSITGTLPSGRYASCGIYDSFQDKLIIFGGYCRGTPKDSITNETWALDFDTQEWDSLNTTNNPSPREYATAVYDTVNHRMIVFGGDNTTGNLSDVWSLNLSTYEWTQLADYQNTVSAHSAVFDPQHNYMIAVAGNGLYSHGQAAVFSTSENGWLDLSVDEYTPSVRYSSRAIWDPNNSCVVMFGGCLSGTVDWNETWKFSVEVVVPVEISTFNATVASTQVKLEWRTKTEVNNYGFEIERRTIGKSNMIWNKIGFVAGSGTSNSPHEYSFLDHNLTPGRYVYRMKQIDNDGSFKYYGNAEVELLPPLIFALDQNFPNPFNPITTMAFSVPEQTAVTLKVYDLLGKEVATLMNNEIIAAGNHSKQWNAEGLPSGVYFYRLSVVPSARRDLVPTEGRNGQAGTFIETKKLILLK